MAGNEEVSIIAHLLEVEKQASQVISVANVKADKKISEAKIAADAEFKKLFTEKSDKIQNDFNENKTKIVDEHNKVMEEYKSSVENKAQNKENFNAFLDKVLFE